MSPRWKKVSVIGEWTWERSAAVHVAGATGDEKVLTHGMILCSVEAKPWVGERVSLLVARKRQYVYLADIVHKRLDRSFLTQMSVKTCDN